MREEKPLTTLSCWAGALQAATVMHPPNGDKPVKSQQVLLAKLMSLSGYRRPSENKAGSRLRTAIIMDALPESPWIRADEDVGRASPTPLPRTANRRPGGKVPASCQAGGR